MWCKRVTGRLWAWLESGTDPSVSPYSAAFLFCACWLLCQKHEFGKPWAEFYCTIAEGGWSV